MAYDVKLNSMPRKAASVFKKRQPNFFKANSKVIQAKGLKVNEMHADVGFYSNNLKGSHNESVKDLEKQEYGGSIDKKKFIAEKGARGGSTLGLIKPNRQLKKLPSLINRVAVTNGYGRFNGKLKKIKSKKQRFIRAAFVAEKKFGGFVLGNKNANSNRSLSVITSIGSDGDHVSIKRTALYNVRNGRRVKVGATQFMKRASFESEVKMDGFFIRNAQKRFVRHLSRA